MGNHGPIQWEDAVEHLHRATRGQVATTDKLRVPRVSCCNEGRRLYIIKQTTRSGRLVRPHLNWIGASLLYRSILQRSISRYYYTASPHGVKCPSLRTHRILPLTRYFIVISWRSKGTSTLSLPNCIAVLLHLTCICCKSRSPISS